MRFWKFDRSDIEGECVEWKEEEEKTWGGCIRNQSGAWLTGSKPNPSVE